MHNQQQLDLFFSQALDGFFFMMLDEPIRWDNTVDKEALLDYVFDHHRITRVNDAMLQQYRAAREQYIGLTPRDLFAHDLVQGRKVWRQFFDTGHLHIETDERRFDGSAMWVEGDYICLYDEDGRITGHFGIQRDVTSRKIAEQKLRESEERYRALFEQNIDGVILLSLDKRIIAGNRQASILFGYPQEDFPKLIAHDLVIPDQRESIDLNFNRLLNGEILPTYERTYLRRDGSQFYAEVSTSLVHGADGTPLHYQAILRDISHRKQIEEALRESEERYRQMFENNYAIKLVIDPENGSILDANAAALNYYGYSLDELRQMHIWDINIKAADEIHQEMAKASSGERQVFNFQHRLASGEIRDVEVYSGPVRVRGKKFLYSIINDVTERRKIADALRESEERYRHVVEAQTELICRYGPDLTISFVNEAFCRWCEKSADEVIGQNYLNFVPEDLHDSMREQIRMMFQTARLSTVTYERTITRPGGEFRWYSWVERIISGKNGQPVEIQAVGRDITELKTVQNALWDSEQRFLSILNSLHDLVWSVKLPQMTVSYMNAVSDKVYQRRAVEFMHENWQWSSYIYPEDHLIFQRMRNRIVNDGYAEAEYRIVRRDGEIRWLQERGWMVKNVSGKNIRIDGIATDITERKQSEMNKLDLAVEKERVQMLASFVRDISHEFRTPLAIINSCMYLIEKIQDPTKRTAQIEQAKSQVSLIARLLDTLLTMSKLDSGVTFNFVPTNVNELLNMLASRYQPAINEKKLNLVLELADELPRILIDRGQFAQAFGNLLDNAVRYTPSDGTITFRSALNDKCVRVEIRDTGIGIEPNALPHVFERFWRLDQAHTTPGFGLGLPIAQKIIEQHGGSLDVESTPDQGSTFLIQLPVRG